MLVVILAIIGNGDCVRYLHPQMSDEEVKPHFFHTTAQLILHDIHTLQFYYIPSLLLRKIQLEFVLVVKYWCTQNPYLIEHHISKNCVLLIQYDINHYNLIPLVLYLSSFRLICYWRCSEKTSKRKSVKKFVFFLLLFVHNSILLRIQCLKWFKIAVLFKALQLSIESLQPFS